MVTILNIIIYIICLLEDKIVADAGSHSHCQCWMFVSVRKLKQKLTLLTPAWLSGRVGGVGDGEQIRGLEETFAANRMTQTMSRDQHDALAPTSRRNNPPTPVGAVHRITHDRRFIVSVSRSPHNFFPSLSSASFVDAHNLIINHGKYNMCDYTEQSKRTVWALFNRTGGGRLQKLHVCHCACAIFSLLKMRMKTDRLHNLNKL